MIKENKRGQVATFVIVGVILLIIVGVLVLISSSKKEDETKVKLLSSGTFQEKVDYVIATCIDNVVRDEQQAFFDNGGYIGPAPNNLIFHGDDLVLTVYDRDYPDVLGIDNPETFSAILEDQLASKLPSCVAGVSEELNKQYDDFDVYLDGIDSKLNIQNIVVSYHYTIEKGGTVNDYESTKVFNSDIYFFINEVNNLSREFLYSLDAPDVNFNYQICVSLNESMGYKPSYPVDFLKIVEQRDYADLLMAEDYMLVKLERNGKELEVAIKPYRYPAIC